MRNAVCTCAATRDAQKLILSVRNSIPPGVFTLWRTGQVRSLCAANVSVCADVSSHSGKTSLIHSLAGELNLDIYVVSLSSKGCVQLRFASAEVILMYYIV